MKLFSGAKKCHEVVVSQQLKKLVLKGLTIAIMDSQNLGVA